MWIPHFVPILIYLFIIYDRRWIKFGKPHDFVPVGKEIVATASGIYVSFLDLKTGERRIERFDNKKRGDSASRLAGHSICISICRIIIYNYIYLCFINNRLINSRSEQCKRTRITWNFQVIPMFSVVERKLNPMISIFMYPATLRRISRCAFPDKVNDYLSCSLSLVRNIL